MAASGRSRVGGCDVTCIRSIYNRKVIFPHGEDDTSVGTSFSKLPRQREDVLPTMADLRVYAGTPGWVGRRQFFRPLTTSAILVPVFPTGWDLARSKKGLRFLASSVPGVNAIR
ncbi:hypothetical protein AVEN_98381-1 [Araneus ventricosus]|uniref:Uncharacterized protein n=1 Tax=Araneus ventricosus TaxID=182803 RepID=A0A4Y2D0H2_ARAVE|nr:hypothetical protein AVEN_98381-1 [Araneus ventricosus]